MNRLENIQSQQQKGQYFYTQGGQKLTQEQRDFYEENGYLVIKNLINPEDYQRYTKRFIEYCEETRERPLGMAMVRDISLAKKGLSKAKGEQYITKIQDWQDDEVLFEFCKNQKVLEIVNDIIGINVKSVHTMLINKPPGMGKSQRHPLHQDLAYFPFRPAERIVCCWSAMEDVSRENGGLVIYPGTHKMPFVEHGYPDWGKEGGVNKGYWGILEKYMPNENAVKVHPEMKAGDCVFFHPHVLHGSGQNKTQRYRKSISCHYAANECFYIDTKGTNNEIVDKGITEFAKKSLGVDMDYCDIWRTKSRQVSGQDLRTDNNNLL